MAEREHGGEFGAFLTGFLTGALVGAVVALLFAPRSGEETRRLLQERGIELKTQAEELTAQARSQAEAALRSFVNGWRRAGPSLSRSWPSVEAPRLQQLASRPRREAVPEGARPWSHRRTGCWSMRRGT